MIKYALKEVSYGGSVQDFRNGERRESRKDRQTSKETDHCVHLMFGGQWTVTPSLLGIRSMRPFINQHLLYATTCFLVSLPPNTRGSQPISFTFVLAFSVNHNDPQGNICLYEFITFPIMQTLFRDERENK